MCGLPPSQQRSRYENRHPLPRIYDLLDKFGDAKVFSLSDLKAEYARMRLRPDDMLEPCQMYCLQYCTASFAVVYFGGHPHHLSSKDVEEA